MPVKSKTAFKFFKMLENNPEMAKEHGITVDKAKEFTKENKGNKRFSKLKKRIGIKNVGTDSL